MIFRNWLNGYVSHVKWAILKRWPNDHFSKYFLNVGDWLNINEFKQTLVDKKNRHSTALTNVVLLDCIKHLKVISCNKLSDLWLHKVELQWLESHFRDLTAACCRVSIIQFPFFGGNLCIIMAKHIQNIHLGRYMVVHTVRNHLVLYKQCRYQRTCPSEAFSLSVW